MPVSDFTLRVVRADDLLVVTFEFFNLVLDANTTGGAPRLVRRSADAESRIVVHLQPQNISERAFDVNFAAPSTTERIPSMIAGSSRLAFILPTGEASIPFTLDDLLDWSRLLPVPPPPPGPPREPEPAETAIELPYRLVLAPTGPGRWKHRRLPFGPGDRHELWHTTYAGESSAVLEPADAPREFPLTAVWTPDLQPGAPTSNPFPMTLNPEQRVAIVRQSAQPTLFGEQLRLSALGGWLTVRGPSWNHDVAMGRDQRVRTQSRGVLYPFGHEVSLVTTSERRFVHEGARAAYVVQKTVLYILDPVRKFSDGAFPFTQISISQPVALIDTPSNPNQPFVPTVRRVPFRFPVTALDQLNPPRIHQFGAALVFVPENSNDPAAVPALYAPHATIDMANQSIGFAPDLPSLAERDAAGPTERTVLRTFTMTLGEEITTGSKRRFPVMKEASVVVPAAEQLYGAVAEPATIVFNKVYQGTKSDDPDGGFARTDVFADFKDALLRDHHGLRLSLPAEKAGGLAAPNLEMTAVSAVQGAFPDVKAAVASMSPEAIVTRFFGGKLLGVIELASVVKFSDLPEDLPQIQPQAGNPPGMAFTWKPQLREPLPPPLEKLEGSLPGLKLAGTIAANSASVSGVLSFFAITFLNLLKLEFNDLTFRTQSGQSLKFGASLKKFTFTGQLEFVNELTNWLPKDGFGGSGPSIKTSLEGVSAGLSLALPKIPLGPIILQNLALSAELNLYFFEKPASVTFRLSSKKDPFIVTYTVFGGGGYFSLTVDTEKKVQLEAALGFGGAAEIDLIIAKGAIQAMVWIQFELDGSQSKLTGFVRIYGCVEILKLVSISVEFYMGLAYSEPYAIGSASLTVMVRVLAFSKSVTLSVERRFKTTDAPGLAADTEPAMITRDQWREYCLSFANL